MDGNDSFVGTEQSGTNSVGRSGPGQSRAAKPGTSQRSTARTLRGPLFPGTPSRSISLPQALHSFTLSTQASGDPKLTAHPAAPEIGTDLHGSASPGTRGRHYGANGEIIGEEASFAGDATTRNTSIASSSSAPAALMPAPLSPQYKRAISEGHGNSIMTPHGFGRSATTTKLPEIIYGDTELLDPLPKVDAQLSGTQHFLTEAEELRQVSQSCRRQMLIEPNLLSPRGSVSVVADNRRVNSTQTALSNADILHHIFDALDAMTIIPHELVQQRRKPLSLRHAQLIFGDTKRATEAWENSQPTTTAHSPGAGLYSCLFVNSAWHDAAVRVLETRIHFRKNDQWMQFARRGVSALTRKPRMLVLHKLNEATQVELDMLDEANLGDNLEWLEFYTCAGLAPPASMLGAQLTRIILPGCYRVNDRTLAHIAEHCSQLKHLDVRACEQVSDRGIKMVAKNCPQLELLNVGRTRGGENITYKGIKHLARQTQLTTLGIAGCHIDDRAIWELALNRGPHLQRLSLNNCRALTDASVPRVLGYMPNLTVLEIRGCVQITHMRPLALFKVYRERLGQPPLIEGCEVIERRMQVAILRLQREMSQRMLNDLLLWANGSDDDDDRY